MLNKYVQCIIGYIRFGPFIDMKEEWSKKVLLDKISRVKFVTVSSKSTYSLVMNIFMISVSKLYFHCPFYS